VVNCVLEDEKRKDSFAFILMDNLFLETNSELTLSFGGVMSWL